MRGPVLSRAHPRLAGGGADESSDGASPRRERGQNRNADRGDCPSDPASEALVPQLRLTFLEMLRRGWASPSVQGS